MLVFVLGVVLMLIEKQGTKMEVRSHVKGTPHIVEGSWFLCGKAFPHPVVDIRED